jgi:glycosyltransferase involved in cell wall biosynthesis
MRIAILHYTKPPVIGGVERVIRDQANALIERGHDVVVLTRVDSHQALSAEAVIVHNVFTMPFDLDCDRSLESADPLDQLGARCRSGESELCSSFLG